MKAKGKAVTMLDDAIRGLGDHTLVRMLERQQTVGGADLSDAARDLIRAEILRRMAARHTPREVAAV